MTILTSHACTSCRNFYAIEEIARKQSGNHVRLACMTCNHHVEIAGEQVMWSLNHHSDSEFNDDYILQSQESFSSSDIDSGSDSDIETSDSESDSDASASSESSENDSYTTESSESESDSGEI